MKKILMLIILAATAFAQPATPKVPYDSTRAQLSVERQKNLQLTANQQTQQFQASMKELQEKYRTMEAELAAWEAEVRKANGWDETYVYDREKDVWNHNLPEAKAEPKADSKK